MKNNSQEPVGEMVDKIECLIGYLQAWQKGSYLPLELNDVIQEAKDWVNSLYTQPPAPIKTEGEDERTEYYIQLTKNLGKTQPYHYTGPKCVPQCENFPHYETKHHKDCPFYKNSLSEKYDKIAPPAPVGIDVDALAKQKAKEKYPGEMNMRGYKINAQKNNQEKFIEGFKAGYSASLPQSSTGGLPKLYQPILDDDDVKGIIGTQSSTEEEK